MKGFSHRNLASCRQFYQFYLTPSNLQQPVANFKNNLAYASDYDEITAHPASQILWGHNVLVFSKSESVEEAKFYLQQTIENGWSRDILALQIKSKLYNRQGKAVTNFKETLPDPFSDLTQQTLKDPYVFDFLSLETPFKKKDIERQSVIHITKFLLELGKGFAFIGQQYQLKIGETDYYVDLLFYYTKLKCYVVIELKNTKFIPEYAGKLNFYLSAVDTLVKQADDNPTIGILLCRDKNNFETEFALRDINDLWE
jgi:predicted nuclease of restriction endonuclease-like (RecB) superfamily